MAQRYVLGEVAGFPPGSRRVVRVAGREIGVFRVDDDFYAIRNRCPHQGAPLCLGPLRNRVVSPRPGEFSESDGAPLIVCPWHGWQYDAATGEAYAPGEPGVKTYDVSIDAGRDLEAKGAQLVVETFEISMEGDCVVLYA